MSAAATYTPRERIKFDFNRPVMVQLESLGKETAGRDGTEYQYFCEGHRIMWIPLAAHEQIERAGAVLGTELEITRARHGRDASTWEVVHIQDPSEFEQAVRATEWAPASRPETRQQQRPAPTPVSQPRSAQRPASSPSDARQDQQPTPAPAAAAPQSASMYTALCAAIHTTAAAEKYAQQIGRPVVFGAEDVRAIANTLYIRQEGGR